jgi:hypothetical protein
LASRIQAAEARFAHRLQKIREIFRVLTAEGKIGSRPLIARAVINATNAPTAPRGGPEVIIDPIGVAAVLFLYLVHIWTTPRKRRQFGRREFRG